ncbi:MAG: type II toxin-antitoxin system HicA family toxin [Nitrospina sp.]|nr:MAG: type II toxin-antitoxin system HicA family toxin [Nitrospina sp.]
MGFAATRQKGSHVRLEKSLPQETVKITAPPLHSQLKKGTLKPSSLWGQTVCRKGNNPSCQDEPHVPILKNKIQMV